MEFLSDDDEEYLPPALQSEVGSNGGAIPAQGREAEYDTSYTSYSSDEYHHAVPAVPAGREKTWNTRAQVNMSHKSLEELEADKQLLDMLDQQMSSSSFEPFNEEHFTLEDLEEYLQAYNEEDDADYLPDRDIRDIRAEIRIPQRELDLLLEDAKKGGEESVENILSDTPELVNAVDMSKLSPVSTAQASRLKRLLRRHVKLLHDTSAKLPEAEKLLRSLGEMVGAVVTEYNQKMSEYPEAVKVYEEQKKILEARGFRKTRLAERELRKKAGKSLIVRGLEVIKPTKSLLMSKEFLVVHKAYASDAPNRMEMDKIYGKFNANVQDRLLCSNGREKFTVDEEKLLLLGLERFTLKDLPTIHQHLLPVMTPSQLHNRYKNRSSLLLSHNIIQEYKQRKIKRPLTDNELARFKEGIAFCGGPNHISFDLISDKFLPHLGSDCLRATFKAYKLGRKKKRSAPSNASSENDENKHGKRSRAEANKVDAEAKDAKKAAPAKKWQKPHDREILLAVKRDGANDATFHNLSQFVLFAGVFSEAEIRERYTFLLEMLQQNRPRGQSGSNTKAAPA